MTKTVKEFDDFSFLELIEYFKDKCNEYDSENKYFLPLTDLNRFELLEEKYKNELAEKDRKIDLLLTANKKITYSTKSRGYNQQQLYKEDFDIGRKFDSETNELIISSYRLKDNSKYELLPSKEENK